MIIECVHSTPVSTGICKTCLLLQESGVHSIGPRFKVIFSTLIGKTSYKHWLEPYKIFSYTLGTQNVKQTKKMSWNTNLLWFALGSSVELAAESLVNVAVAAGAAVITWNRKKERGLWYIWTNNNIWPMADLIDNFQGGAHRQLVPLRFRVL